MNVHIKNAEDVFKHEWPWYNEVSSELTIPFYPTFHPQKWLLKVTQKVKSRAIFISKSGCNFSSELFISDCFGLFYFAENE